jgi:hypothetical protein
MNVFQTLAWIKHYYFCITAVSPEAIAMLFKYPVSQI